MRLVALLAVMPVMLSPSYSYAQSHRGIPTYTPVIKSLPPLPKGNGIYNYSVATDYYYGTQNPVGQPSLAYDLGNYPNSLSPNSASNIIYVFPDFVSLNGLSYYGGSVASFPTSSADFSQTQCAYDPNKNKGLNGSNIIEYVALPELNLAAVGQTLSPTLTTAVGNYCYNGAAVTQYYKNINGGQLKVIPNASYADVSFPTMIATGNKSNTLAIADALANVINQDPSTLGLAIDNEPSINGINKNPSSKQLNPTSVQNEQLFFQELASQLAMNNKYLFLFDAPDTARVLFGSGLTNVIVMSYLYDLGNTDPSKPSAYNPTPLGTGNNQDTTNYTYSGMVYNAAASALSDTPNNVYKGQSQQVTLVLPASATSSLWDYDIVYNVAPGSTSSSVNPVLPAATASAVIANSPNNCTNNPIPNPSTNPPASQTLMLNLLFPSQVNIVTFFNNTNCFKYTNPLSLTNQSMEQYFATSLDAVKKANANPNSHYLGVTLYAWKIAADNDLQAGKSSVLSAYGPNGYISKTTPNISLQGPPNIKPEIWNLLNKWQGPISK